MLVIAGCQENLAGGAACPSLCPDTLSLRDTVLVAREVVDTDATILGMPPLGTESQVLLADYRRGAAHDQRIRTVGVLRFDSLQRAFADTDTTKPPKYFDRVDSAGLVLRLITSDTVTDTAFVKDTVSFLVYDVDGPGSDFDTAAVRARFSGTPIASRKVPKDSVHGSIRIPLDSGFMAQHVRSGTRIRLGVAVESPQDVQVRIGSNEGGNASTLAYFGFVDTTKLSATVVANTRSASGPTVSSLADYTLVLDGSPPPAPGVLAAGGIPSSRIFLRFDLPQVLVDSATTVVRANLELHQVANPLFPSSDSLSLLTRVVRAKPDLSDITKASLLIADPSALGVRVPPITASPAVARVDTLPLVGLMLAWKAEGPTAAQRAIVLQSSAEGLDPRQYLIYSSSASEDSLRPRLHISYIPRSGFGLP
ncbi:MAG TPA: hypothetical protein VFS44_00635 [Gemmatimonadaceae bacterium]|nr:hypothetical protein [Gemmatimonadaceae bacterium]